MKRTTIVCLVLVFSFLFSMFPISLVPTARAIGENYFVTSISISVNGGHGGYFSTGYDRALITITVKEHTWPWDNQSWWQLIQCDHIYYRVSNPNGITVAAGSDLSTDPDGKVTFNFMPLSVGYYKVEAWFAGDYKFVSNFWNEHWSPSSNVTTLEAFTGDFWSTVSSSAYTHTVYAGQSATYDIIVQSHTHSSIAIGDAFLSLEYLTPYTSSVTSSFNPPQVYLWWDHNHNYDLPWRVITEAESKLTVTTTSETQSGTYTFVVSSLFGGTIAEKNFTLIVMPALKIMPLGDSITYGWPPDIATTTGGYREQLKNDLQSSGMFVDFVGNNSDGSFLDNQHDGYPGNKTVDILNKLDQSNGLLDISKPDVILLHIGTNDIYYYGNWLSELGLTDSPNNRAIFADKVVYNVMVILHSIDAWVIRNNHPVKVILAQIILQTDDGDAGVQKGTLESITHLFNVKLQSAVAHRDLVLVDMEHALNYPIDLQGDGIHPTQTGYVKMAAVWYNALIEQFGGHLFENGFENNFAGWTATWGSPTIVSSPVYSGNNVMRCSDPYNSHATIHISPQNTLYTQAEFQLNSNFAGSVALIGYFDASGNPISDVGLSKQNGRLFVTVETYLPNHSYAQYEITGSLSTNTWFNVGMAITPSSCDVYYNGQPVQIILRSGMTPISEVAVGMFWAGAGAYQGALYVDNVEIGGPPAAWSQTYGGTGDDVGRSVVQTFDGGYAIAGTTSSFGVEGSDVYLVKSDSAGNIQWSKTYGGTGDDVGYSVVQTFDGGYAIAGTTSSFGVEGSDVYLVKSDSAGNMQWNKTYGGAHAYSVVQTSDGGYAIAGEERGGIYLVKTDSAGNMQWNKTYEPGDNIWPYEPRDNIWCTGWSVVQTSDGGYAIAGEITQGTITTNAGYTIVHLVKTDSAGNIVWSRVFVAGGTNTDVGRSVVQTFDGGYAIAGTAYGAGINVYLVKTDSGGTQVWSQTYGGPLNCYGYSVVQTSDGGYAIAGTTFSYDTLNDVYLVKIDSAGNMQWSKTFGGTGDDVGYSVVQTSDGGYAIAGETYSFGDGGSDVYLVKTDVNGNLA
jgi:lysophospholipase L1-like esterase